MIKNALLYLIASPIEQNLLEFEEALRKKAFTEPASTAAKSVGFVAPGSIYGLEEMQPFARKVMGTVVIAIKSAVRNVNPNELRKLTDDRVKEIERREARTIYKREKQDIKDEVFASLLPKTFPDYKKTFVFINPDLGRIYVGASSPNAAEDCLNLMREALESLKIIPVSSVAKTSSDYVYTDLVAQANGLCKTKEDDEEAPRPTSYFEADFLAAFADIDGGKASFSNRKMDGEDITLALNEGLLCSEVGLCFYGPSFVCRAATDFALKGIKLSDETENEAQDFDSDEDEHKHYSARIDAEVIVYADVLNTAYKLIHEKAGGDWTASPWIITDLDLTMQGELIKKLEEENLDELDMEEIQLTLTATLEKTLEDGKGK